MGGGFEGKTASIIKGAFWMNHADMEMEFTDAAGECAEQ